MTSRERILSAINGRPTDRTAVAPFVYSSTVAAWKQDSYIDIIAGTIEFCKHYGFDLIHRNIPVRHSDYVTADNWEVSVHRDTYDDKTLITTDIQTPGGGLRRVESIMQLTPFQSVSATRECMIKTERDFELFRRYVPAPVPPDFEALRRAKELIGTDGVCAPWVWGVFNYMEHLRPLDLLLTDPYVEPEFYSELSQFALERLMTAIEPLLTQGVDLLSYTGNIANGTMVGPSYFRQYVHPCEKQLVDFIQARCEGIIYHNCGDADNMTQCYNCLEPKCYESMTEPPYANNSLEKAVKEFATEITLIGNIDQIDFLRNATAEDVYDKARRILDLVSGRRFILGTSDLLEEDTPHENLFALARAARM